MHIIQIWSTYNDLECNLLEKKRRKHVKLKGFSTLVYALFLALKSRHELLKILDIINKLQMQEEQTITF